MVKSEKQKKHLDKLNTNRSGENHQSWKGGKRKTGNLGYIRQHCPSHPLSDNQGYILEHRFIMERHIGRTLLKTEVVHHINGIRNDNRIENLMLFANNSEHIKSHKRPKKWGSA
jgi:hypothetical protein